MESNQQVPTQSNEGNNAFRDRLGFIQFISDVYIENRTLLKSIKNFMANKNYNNFADDYRKEKYDYENSINGKLQKELNAWDEESKKYSTKPTEYNEYFYHYKEFERSLREQHNLPDKFPLRSYDKSAFVIRWLNEYFPANARGNTPIAATHFQNKYAIYQYDTSKEVQLVLNINDFHLFRQLAINISLSEKNESSLSSLARFINDVDKAFSDKAIPLYKTVIGTIDRISQNNSPESLRSELRKNLINNITSLIEPINDAGKFILPYVPTVISDFLNSVFLEATESLKNNMDEESINENTKTLSTHLIDKIYEIFQDSNFSVRFESIRANLNSILSAQIPVLLKHDLGLTQTDTKATIKKEINTKITLTEHDTAIAYILRNLILMFVQLDPEKKTYLTSSRMQFKTPENSPSSTKLKIAQATNRYLLESLKNAEVKDLFAKEKHEFETKESKLNSIFVNINEALQILINLIQNHPLFTADNEYKVNLKQILEAINQYLHNYEQAAKAYKEFSRKPEETIKQELARKIADEESSNTGKPSEEQVPTINIMGFKLTYSPWKK